MKGETEPTRAVAGLVLKNNVRLYYDKFPEETKTYVKQESLGVVTDESPIIRATAGTLVSTIALCGQLIKWPELLPSLCQLIDNSEQLACEVSPPVSQSLSTCSQPLTGCVSVVSSGLDKGSRRKGGVCVSVTLALL